MYKVKRSLSQGKEGSPLGDVVPLESISRFIQLIPEFGKRKQTIKNTAWTPYNSMDIPTSFYVNSFADKEIYQAVW